MSENEEGSRILFEGGVNEDSKKVTEKEGEGLKREDSIEVLLILV